jgi:predicted HTH domain antitoxin
MLKVVQSSTINTLNMELPNCAPHHMAGKPCHKVTKKESSMSETIVEVRVPVSLLQLGIDREEVQRRVTEWLVLSLFIEEHISSGKAARLLNMSRIDFLALLRARGIAFVDYSEDELADEFAAVAALPVKEDK